MLEGGNTWSKSYRFKTKARSPFMGPGGYKCHTKFCWKKIDLFFFVPGVIRGTVGQNISAPPIKGSGPLVLSGGLKPLDVYSDLVF